MADADKRPDDDATTTDGAPESVKVGRQPRPATQTIGRIAVALAAAVFVVFALANSQFVEFSWLFGRTEIISEGGDRIGGGIRLIYLLLAAFGLGAVVGGGLVLRRGSKRRRRKD